MTEIEGVETVAVVGGGTIGLSWTLVFVRAGLRVRLLETDSRQLDSFPHRFQAACATLERADAWDGGPDRLTERIAFCSSVDEVLAGAQYVQECAPEDLGVKREVFRELDELAGEQVVLGSSTSAHPMTQIAAATARHPERCLVVHPTNPPHIVPLVELVPGEATADDVVDHVRRFMLALGQTPILCRHEIFGFVLNRLQFALEREAFFLARRGVASIEDIDKCVSDGLGLRWALLGPFAVEETNGDDIEDDLRKFNAGMRALMADVCQPFDGPDEDDIQRAVDGVRYVLRDRTHDELLSYRDEAVLAIRRLKAGRSGTAGRHPRRGAGSGSV